MHLHLARILSAISSRLAVPILRALILQSRTTLVCLSIGAPEKPLSECHQCFREFPTILSSDPLAPGSSGSNIDISVKNGCQVPDKRNLSITLSSEVNGECAETDVKSPNHPFVGRVIKGSESLKSRRRTLLCLSGAGDIGFITRGPNDSKAGFRSHPCRRATGDWIECLFEARNAFSLVQLFELQEQDCVDA